MTKLNTDITRTFEIPNDANSVPVAEGAKIYEGALVGRNAAGYGRPLQAGDAPAGFAKDHVDNANGDDGDKNAELKSKGKVALTIGGITTADVGRKVYASDDDTFTLTKAGNSFVGFVARIEKDGTAIVAFDFLFTETEAAAAQPTNENGGE